MVDDTHIWIGDSVMIGPNVTIATAAHPILPALRKKAAQYNLPVRIGDNVWIGAGAIILPGVTIGENRAYAHQAGSSPSHGMIHAQESRPNFFDRICPGLPAVTFSSSYPRFSPTRICAFS